MGPAFDRQAVQDRFGGDLELLREVAELFLASLPSRLEEIRSAHAEGDRARVKSMAHLLKGSVGNFLATDAASAAFRVQQLATAAGEPDLSDAIVSLEQHVHHLAHALESFRVDVRHTEAD